jgi:hypothetical protein
MQTKPSDTPPAELSASFKPSADVLGERIGREVILVNLRTNYFYRLNHTAGRAWELLGAYGTHGLARRLEAEFSSTSLELDREVADFLAVLEREELVVREIC